ncbi:hypothetical protein DUNSADRAFT_1179 [Dunaliella salina]|uniref:Transferrin-like domain-containing protein n=1 Tax=Dunaliella salina TaxID=3046 RepID=A0ABQ7FXY3_DUNSA|nr:hypothetical protein DUNSADRAFT_1179 [Dunaliella salina]|eukprot:KAF5827187.1 hypothetical protein DUNSADRAFT_1179 [Dunaliella salina]
MFGGRTWLRAAFLLLGFTVASVRGKGPVRICVPEKPEAPALAACTAALNAVYSTPEVGFKCIGGETDNMCLFRVSQRQDHLTLVAENELWLAHHLHDLTGYIAEAYESSSGVPAAVAYGLAVVKNVFCSDLPDGWASLKNKGKEYSICSTGYRRTVGFVLPMDKMFKDDIIEDRVIPEDRSINQDAYNMAQFFGSVCSPRTTANGPRRDGSAWEPLCGLCASASNATNSTLSGFSRFNGPPQEHKCSESEDPNDEAYNPYAGYTGAFQCMLDGSDTPDGDDKRIAFTKQTVISQYNTDSRWSNEAKVDEGNFSILCNSACRPFSEWKNDDGSPNEECITGAAASHSLVGKKIHSDGTISPETFAAAIASLSDSSKLSNRVIAETSETEYPFWSAPTLGLYKYRDDDDFTNRLPDFSVIQNKGPDAEPIRVCIPLGETKNLPTFCTNVLNELYGGSFGPDSETFLNFECAIPEAGASYSNCFEAILQGEFDITTAGGNELFQSNKEYGLVALVAESYDDGASTASYFGIQVVKKEQCPKISGLSDLEGMNLCSTGYRKTSGWFLPVGRLFSEGILDRQTDPEENVNSDAYSVSEFFDRICCPR